MLDTNREKNIFFNFQYVYCFWILYLWDWLFDRITKCLSSVYFLHIFHLIFLFLLYYFSSDRDVLLKLSHWYIGCIHNQWHVTLSSQIVFSLNRFEAFEQCFNFILKQNKKKIRKNSRQCSSKFDTMSNKVNIKSFPIVECSIWYLLFANVQKIILKRKILITKLNIQISKVSRALYYTI